MLAAANMGVVKAQGVLQVATKVVEKNIAAPAIRTLHINAEKADIELTTWDKSEISIVMELSARHPDKNTAANDLSKVQYIADRNGKDYFLRNYIVLKDGESKPVSNLRARYKIHLPASCAVNLKNSFGTITLKGLTNSLQLKADFCITTLAEIKGKGQMQTSFGELKVNEISGIFTFTSDHTKVSLQSIAGVIKVDALYGDIELFPTSGLTSLAIKSRKAEVTLQTKNWQNFDYTIQSAYANMKLPNGFKWKRNTTDFKEAFFSKNQLANVDINAEFGRVTIK
ncbi:hypothetical protein SAMN05660293_03729 [Dyadobacter psychrophilus]|uniref:DUF4097 domain-containing protein n=2 Tax=Dyadobacter psychrophilus TaxID=651661 RepID=A0A1T5G6N9_9BACT|nr:hypothetical protein SAMN05660293_03729 [Dyadobacter psychrophilus]